MPLPSFGFSTRETLLAPPPPYMMMKCTCIYECMEYNRAQTFFSLVPCISTLKVCLVASSSSSPTATITTKGAHGQGDDSWKEEKNKRRNIQFKKFAELVTAVMLVDNFSQEEERKKKMVCLLSHCIVAFFLAM